MTVTLLGSRPPAVEPSAKRVPSTKALALHAPFLTGPSAPEVNAAVLAMAGSFIGLSAEKIVLEIEKMARNGQQLDLACLALKRLHPERSAWQPLVQRLARESSEDVGLALIAAVADAEDEDWQGVHGWLAGKDPEPLDDWRSCDFHHLLGLALLHLGKPLEAAREFEIGTRLEDVARQLGPLLDLAQALAQPARVDPADSAIRGLVSAVRIGEQALREGDLETARAALDQPVVWEASEVQSAARLAELYLRDQAASDFRRRHALAFYLHAYSPGQFDYQNLPLLELAWQKSQLEELAERARAWLGS